MDTQPSPRARKNTVIIDFDGSRIRVPPKYRDIKKQSELLAAAKRGECPHPSVMLTIRCQICGVVEVHILPDFPRRGGRIYVGVPEAHTHPI